ncbi:hypothetical protein E4T56_gene3851 [Termitomyces sp. T112]|nr:hypothetical protein E4T56_gene3851 [Termitomyces sp. T112]KAH0585876.1 hypothetical protein H2248_007159 [Termitomyces sp. 'cryptogamus']KNZ73162.1 hypothetical protein J132_00997 [Termitomyces sp. J132]
MANDIGEVTKSGRTLIVCFDGTSNEYNGVETNVIKLFSLLKKDDFNQQICYYQPGIGTWFNPGVVSPFVRWGAQVLDLAFAWYLDQHVIEGYKFLMNNYRVGDKICVFGFSRGSYTARALAGFLHKIGLLPRDNEQQIPFGYKLYKREDKIGLDLCAGFKKTFCQDVKVEFVGVWDTVASVGMLASRTLPFTNSNKAIKTFRHALSLDEHRAKFKPNYYHHPTRKAPVPAKHDSAENTPNLDSFKSTNSLIQKLKRGSNRIKKFYKREIETIFAEETQPEEEGIPDTDVLEVWFSGCHADVGGGTVPDKETHSLANISLRWMVREIQQARCGIIFDEKALQRLEIPRVVFEVDSVTKVEVPTVREQEAEREDNLNAIDALQPMYDQLKVGNKLWWLLELMPLTYMWQDQDKEWHSKLSMNLGRGRKIKDANPNFHETVKLRMDDTRLKYKPKAIWTAGSENYVH